MATRLGDAFRSVVKKASTGTLSTYVINAPHEWGQPLPNVSLSDEWGLITPARMREIVIKTPTAGACLNATLDFIAGVHLRIKSVDAKRPVNQLHKQAV